MNQLALEVHCPHIECWSSHIVHLTQAQLFDGTDTLSTTCPACGEALTVVYEVRAAVKHVRLQGRQYPEAWPLEAGW